MDIVIDTVAVKANLKNLQSLDDIPDPTPEQIAKIMKLVSSIIQISPMLLFKSTDCHGFFSVPITIF